MFTRMRFETANGAGDRATIAAQAHAMGCGTDAGDDPYALVWAARRAANPAVDTAQRVIGRI